MTTQHVKSPCCRSTVRRFGGRRRQCVACGKTWRIRQRRRGRKRLRTDQSLVEAYLAHEFPTVRSIARRRGIGRDRAQRMLQQSLVCFIERRLPTWTSRLPARGPLIAVPDGIWYRVGARQEKRTAYLILLRPVEEQKTVIAPPLILPGHEDLPGWQDAFAALPKSLQGRIEAIVCDGGMGIVAFARKHPGVLQRCHFHLLANLMMYRNPRQHPELVRLFTDVRTVITTTDPKVVRQCLRRIEAERDATRSRGIKRILSGFLTNYRDFQTYLRYPGLNLPTTSNAAESCVSGCQELKRRLRGFRSEEAMRLWLTGYTLWKKTIVCNGKTPTK